jgi:hypothetical protein
MNLRLSLIFKPIERERERERERIANSWQGSSRVINRTANWRRMTN